MAERVVDRLADRLATTTGPERSHEQPLVGGDVDPESLRRRIAGEVGEAAASRLLELYGSEAADVARDGADLGAEVRQAVQREGVLQLEDYWVRRSARAWFECDGGLSCLEPASLEMARLLGWDEDTRRSQIKACRQLHEEGNAVFR
jgi:glycerol-3-phosphate dehydrogenase